MNHRKAFAVVAALGLVASLAANTPASVAATKATTKTTKKAAPTTTKKGAATTTTKAAAAATTAPATTGKSGGKITFGLTLETPSGFLPGVKTSCTFGCYQIMTTITERLLARNAAGGVEPWLADSVTPDPTYKVWTIKVHPGIKFHNGEPLNADAVKANIEGWACGLSLQSWGLLNANGALCKDGKLASSALASDGNMTVTLTFQSPWVALPSFLANPTFAEWVLAPAQIKSGDVNKPIGTGPFKFQDWVVNDHLTVVRNDDYWGPKAKLDSIEFRPVVDESARLAQLQTGELDYAATSNYLTMGAMKELAKAGKIRYEESSPTFGGVEVDYLNNAIPPFNKTNCRMAAAYGQDVDTLIKLRAPGADKVNGPFQKGAMGYLANSGYPNFNLDKAKEFFAKCKAELGGGDVSFTIMTSPSPDNIQTATIQKQMMETVGFKVSLVQNASPVIPMIFGAFQWIAAAVNGSADPDVNYVSWHSDNWPKDPVTKAPVIDGKQVAFAPGRWLDGVMDTALVQLRQNSDPAVRKKAAEAVTQAFGENAYYLWRWNLKWAVGSCLKCSPVSGRRTPKGSLVQDFPESVIFDMGSLYKN